MRLFAFVPDEVVTIKRWNKKVCASIAAASWYSPKYPTTLSVIFGQHA